MKGLISNHGMYIAKRGSEIMDARGGKTFRLSVEDVRDLMGCRVLH